MLLPAWLVQGEPAAGAGAEAGEVAGTGVAVENPRAADEGADGVSPADDLRTSRRCKKEE